MIIKTEKEGLSIDQMNKIAEDLFKTQSHWNDGKKYSKQKIEFAIMAQDHPFQTELTMKITAASTLILCSTWHLIK